VLLRDIARVQIGPEMRRVVADLDGEGEVTGGIVVMRYGENAWPPSSGQGAHSTSCARACRRASRSSRPTTARS
jgi:hypothetical protein